MSRSAEFRRTWYAIPPLKRPLEMEALTLLVITALENEEIRAAGLLTALGESDAKLGELRRLAEAVAKEEEAPCEGATYDLARAIEALRAWLENNPA